MKEKSWLVSTIDNSDRLLIKAVHLKIESTQVSHIAIVFNGAKNRNNYWTELTYFTAISNSVSFMLKENSEYVIKPMTNRQIGEGFLFLKKFTYCVVCPCPVPCLKLIRYGPRPGFSLALGPLIVSLSISMSVKLESPYRLWPKRPRAESTRYKYWPRRTTTTERHPKNWPKWPRPKRPSQTTLGRNDPDSEFRHTDFTSIVAPPPFATCLINHMISILDRILRMRSSEEDRN